MAPQKLPSGSYRVRYVDPNGQRKSRTFRLRKDAVQFEGEVRRAVRDGAYSVAAEANRKVTYGEWAARYLDRSRDTLRPKTMELRENLLRCYILPKWADVRLGSIDGGDVEDWVRSLRQTGKTRRGRPLSANTVTAIYQTFKVVYLSAYRSRVIVSNNLPVGLSLAAAKVKPERYLAVEEVEALACAIDPAYRALVWIGCTTGLRIGELLGLRLNDIFWESGRLRVDEQAMLLGGKIVFGPPKTKTSKRVVSLTRRARSELRLHIQRHRPDAGPDDLVFVSRAGTPIFRSSFVEMFFRPAVEKANLEPFTPHDMRHTAASLMIAMGYDMFTMMKELGHSNTHLIESTYGHILDSHRLSIAAKADAYIEAKLGESALDEAAAKAASDLAKVEKQLGEQVNAALGR